MTDTYMKILEAYRETLMWYAKPHSHPNCLAPCCIDNGMRAKKALEAEFPGTDANGSPAE